MAQKQYKTVIHWFRRDLRVHDNTALMEACRQGERVIPLFVVDEAILKRPDTGAARVVFMLDALQVLDANLRKCGACLILRRGSNPDTLLQLAREYKADAIFFNRDYEPYARKRDGKVIEEAQKLGIVAEGFKDQVLFEPDELLSKGGTHYTVYSPYKRLWFDTTAEKPREMPSRIPMPELFTLHGEEIPTPESLNLETSQKFKCGGEDAALAALEFFIEKNLDVYDGRRNDLAGDVSSRLSRHFHLGTIGVRTVVQAARTHWQAEKWLSEIAWRDFYTMILWQYPKVEHGPLKPQFERIKWAVNPEHLKAWQEGRTGYPIVDAAMRQMNGEAWMHNRGRMIVASFLCKDLLINWQDGERYFMKMLVDGDLALNNGGWQWVAGTGTDAQPYFRIFNPIMQGKNFDPNGDYIRRWVPELAKVPNKAIHEPWKLTFGEQEFVGCVLGRDYPKPIVDHSVQRGLALHMYRAASAPAPDSGGADDSQYGGDPGD